MKPSGIGGQAVIEGVMMRNGAEYAVAVRTQDGKIVVNEQIYGLLSDPKKLEMLLNSGIVGRLLKELGRQKES